MSELSQSETKVCKMCAEPIKPAAVVCPHCRHVQTTWKLCSPNLTGALTAGLILVCMTGALMLLTRIVGVRNFEPYQSQLTILESSVSQRVTSNAVFVVITGVLTNGSVRSWKDIALEGKLYDREGHLLDAIPATADYFNSGVVAAARSQAAFKIETKTSRTLADYASHQVSVQWARDATSWP
jgi:hypothetical protein